MKPIMGFMKAKKNATDLAENVNSVSYYQRIVPEVNDNGRIMRAHDATPAGGRLIIPNGVFSVTSLIFTKEIHITAFGTLQLAPNTNSDWLLQINGDYSTIEGLVLDGNQANTTSNTGRGECLRVSASYCVIRNCIAKNSKKGGALTGTTFVNAGKHNTFDTCTSFDAGYAGFSNKSDLTGIGDGLKLINCKAFDFDYKGFVHNGSATIVTLDDCYFESDTTNIEADGMLFDPGTGSGNVLENAHVTNCIVKGLTNGSNSLKFELVTNVFVKNCELLGINSRYGLNISSNVNYVSLDNVKLLGSIRAEKETERLILKNVRVKFEASALTILDAINFLGKDLMADGLFLEGTQYGLRLEPLHTSGKQSVNIDNVEFTSSITTGRLFRPITSTGTEHIKLRRYKILNGDTTPLNGLTGASSTDRQIQRQPRIFLANAIPTAGDFLAGDIIYNYTPVASGKVGWVCITSGSPGTWKPFGAIDA